MKQKTVIILGILLILLSLIIDIGNFLNPLPYKVESLVKVLLLNLSLLSFFLVIFAGTTLRLEASYVYWWRYTKFAAPICFALIVAINFGVLHTSTYGTFGFGDMLNQTYDLWALGIVYAAFTLGSIIQIVRGYRAGRQSNFVR